MTRMGNGTEEGGGYGTVTRMGNGREGGGGAQARRRRSTSSRTRFACTRYVQPTAHWGGGGVAWEPNELE